MRMSYAGYGSPLVMMLEEGGVVTDCNIRTLEAAEPTEIDIRATEIPSNIIMKSHWLAEVYVFACYPFRPMMEANHMHAALFLCFRRMLTQWHGIIWQRQRWALHMHGHTHANNANTSSIHTFNTFGICSCGACPVLQS